jgi:glutaminyl-tRNA synthetase
MDPMTAPVDSQPKPSSNFLRQIVERDLADGTYTQRRFAGSPGDAAHHAAGPLDPD